MINFNFNFNNGDTPFTVRDFALYEVSIISKVSSSQHLDFILQGV